MALTQGPRTLNVKTVLGEDKLLLLSFRGREEMSRLFQFQLEMVSDDSGIAAKDVVGTNITFSTSNRDGEKRFFNGFIHRFVAGDADKEGRRSYRADVVPWLWFLTRTTDCRIFQEKTVPEIIEQVFQDLGFSDFKLELKGSHPKHTYRVQYRETDFNFVSRLMEEEGIFYFFRHEDGKHTMILADQASAYVAGDQKTVDYPLHYTSQSEEGIITRWEHSYEFRTGKIAQTDYNFETPSTSLMTNEPTVMKIPGTDKYEFYDYPGDYANTGDGSPLTRLRMEEEEAAHDVVDGESTCRTFVPGSTFSIGKHKVPSEAGSSWVLTTVEHTAREAMPYETGAAGASTDEQTDLYHNTFTSIPSKTVFRPQRTTRRPFVQGPHTAVVVGPAGEKIYPDNYGRVKVQFFWDREGKKDEKSSCWVRVSQNWAGQDWGGVFIPHIGQEVIVEFLEGNPDRPIITGRVYNAEQVIPLDLPAEKTKCMIRDHGNNQMIWEGDKDKQFMHYQQECGNELILNGMKGQESVQLRDKFGSEIFMDSVQGTMRLSSPSHDSSIILGKSLFTKTDSHLASLTGGNTLTGNVGIKHDVYIGQRSQTDIGNYLEAMGGFKVTAVMGAVANFNWGYTVNIRKSKEVTVNKADFVQHSVGNLKIDSETQVGIVGGVEDSGRMRVASDGVVLSYNKKSGAPRPELSVTGVATAVSGMLALGTGIAGGVAIGVCHGLSDKDQTNAAANWRDTMIGAAGAGAGVLGGALLGALGLAKETNKSDMSDWSNGEAEGKVALTQNGVEICANEDKDLIIMKKNVGITVYSKSDKITVDAKEDVLIESRFGDIIAKAKVLNAGKTSIRQKNLLVD